MSTESTTASSLGTTSSSPFSMNPGMGELITVVMIRFTTLSQLKSARIASSGGTCGAGVSAMVLPVLRQVSGEGRFGTRERSGQSGETGGKLRDCRGRPDARILLFQGVDVGRWIALDARPE